MDPAEELREAIEWYLQVIPPRRTSPPGPPSDRARVEAVIEQVDSAIAPFHLPAEIEWFCRNWRPEAFSPLPHPRLADPTSAQELWEDVAGPHFPEVLAPIAYESHGFLLVELGLEAEGPAPVWRYAYGDEAVVLTYPSLASLFRVCATAVEAAGVRPPARAENRWATYADLLGGADFERLAERQLAASAQAGRARQVPVRDLRAWPPAWRVASFPCSEGPGVSVHETDGRCRRPDRTCEATGRLTYADAKL
ncbi:MAG: hypothetical protein JNK12_10965 [Acidimicrobiales bacterium]|nr:hypothetical protein [Acidimicrobiales bacterium]